MSTESEKWKLFLAGAVPESLASSVGAFQSKLKRGFGQKGIELRWTKPDNFHFTLFFLGPTSPDRIPEISSAAYAVAAANPVLPLELHGIGAFPAERSARVLWVGVRNSRELRALQAELSAAMVALGFTAEDREFHPHVTLARLRDARSVREYVDMYRRHDFGEFTMRELVLFRSHSGIPYPRYEALARFPLRDIFSVPLTGEN